MRSIVVRPDAYQEIFLSSKVGFDPAAGKVMIFGKGLSRVAYVGIPDVAAATVALALHADPPSVVELGGPVAITRREAVAAFERALARPIERRHVPRLAMRLGSRLMRRARPELASSMAMSLAMDEADSGLGPAAFVALGITPLSVVAYIEQRAAEITGKKADRGPGAS
jgi:NADH dehydrogenase